jgi:purine/pyrimidine-nucleoside phosphorylase
MIKVNEYFDGKVKSLGFELSATPYTVGVILAGAYTFNTEKIEHLQIVAGALDVKPGAGVWQTLRTGDSITIPAGTSFDLKLKNPAAYICAYK